MWLIVSSQSPHNLHLLFCCVLSMRVFHISVSWWSFTRVWVTTRTLLSILAVLNNIVVWIVSTRLPTSKSSSPFNNYLVTVSKAPITIGTIVTLMFDSFFKFPRKVEVLIFLFVFFQFYSMVCRGSKINYFANSLFFVDYYKVFYYYYYYYYFENFSCQG